MKRLQRAKRHELLRWNESAVGGTKQHVSTKTTVEAAAVAERHT